MRRICRIWWPNQTLSRESSSSSAILFGWFITSSLTSIDIVVAFLVDEVLLGRFQSDLQVTLDNINGDVPAFLSEKSMFSILGYCGTDICSNGALPGTKAEEDNNKKLNTHSSLCKQNEQDMFGQLSCQCCKRDGLFEPLKIDFSGYRNWVQLDYGYQEYPKLNHFHWNGKMVSDCDVHVIVYDTPRFGAHHFSLNFVSPSNHVKTLKKPIWVNELHQEQPLFDLDLTIIAINCADSAKVLFESRVGPKRTVKRLAAGACQLLSVSIASIFTFFYLILQCLHYSLFSYKSKLWLYDKLAKVFSNTWRNVQIRCSQLLYWPILLEENFMRSQSCVEYAEKASLHKHSIWSSAVVDILLGNMIGFTLLYNSKSTCVWFSSTANDITNNFLRVGCVWLMGVPAGFKLNTELASVLGTMCLNAIQIWSTLGFFTSFLFSYYIKGLAISGIVFGVTIPAALIMDTIVLLTVHVSTLLWLLASLYSRQIQAIAALWRLFRGQKWNPLRQRLDSYDYTVEQHIVGSLLFTPLLLLLPTTSVFYIFFSLVNSTISVIRILIEITISLLHATPYNKILFWLVTQARFPSGIWFDIISCQTNKIDSEHAEYLEKIGTTSESSDQANSTWEKRSCYLVSALRSNYLNIGQVVFPHFKDVFSGVSKSLVLSSACGVFTGKRFPSSLGTGLPPKLPWKFIPFKEYWLLCRGAVLSCMKNHD